MFCFDGAVYHLVRACYWPVVSQQSIRACQQCASCAAMARYKAKRGTGPPSPQPASQHTACVSPGAAHDSVDSVERRQPFPEISRRCVEVEGQQMNHGYASSPPSSDSKGKAAAAVAVAGADSVSSEIMQPTGSAAVRQHFQSEQRADVGEVSSATSAREGARAE